MTDEISVSILEIEGIAPALYGLGLSYGVTSNLSYPRFVNTRQHSNSIYKKMLGVSNTLFDKDLGHNKFLRMVQIWMQIKAPMFWWFQFDTYKVGTTSQSESKMHTLGRTNLTVDHFCKPVPQDYIDYLNSISDMARRCSMLPMGFLQTRVVNLNLAVLLNIIKQRKRHIVSLWSKFIELSLKELKLYANLDRFPAEWLYKLRDITFEAGNNETNL